MIARFLTIACMVATPALVCAEPPLIEVPHSGPVQCVAYSPDGKWLASGSSDGAIHLTDLTTGKIIQTFATGKAVLGVTFSREQFVNKKANKWIGVSNEGGQLSIWDVKTGKQVKRFSFGGAIASRYNTPLVAFAKNGQEMVGVGVGQKILWRHARGGASGSRTHNPPSDSSAAVAADGSIMAWTWNGSIRLYQTEPRRYSYLHNMKDITALAFSATGGVLAMGKQNGTIWLHNSANQNNKDDAKLGTCDSEPQLLAFSGDGKILAALALENYTLYLWDLQGKRLRRRLLIHQKKVHAIALSPNGRTVATAGDKSVFVWNVATRDLGKLGPPIMLSVKEMEQLWSDLYASGTDKKAFDKADSAFRRLARGQEKSLPFLQQKIRNLAIPKVDFKQIDAWVAKLDHKYFPIRKKAMSALRKSGQAAIKPLQKLLAGNPSLEASRRAKSLLAQLSDPPLTPDHFRAMEGLELMEIIATTEILQFVEELADESLDLIIREDAKRTLTRLRNKIKS